MKFIKKLLNKGLFLVFGLSLFVLFFIFEFSGLAKEVKEIRFSFSPKDGTTYIQKLITLREKQIGSAGTQTEESVSTTKISIKKTKEGWDVIAKPESAIMKKNGQIINNPIVNLLTKITLIFKLDQQGAIKDVVGFETLTKMINSQFPPPVVKKLETLLNSEILKQKEIAEWNGRVGDYLGKTISIDDIWENEIPYTLPNGVNLVYKVKTHFKSLKPCGKTNCVLIEQVYDSTIEGMDSLANDLLKPIVEKVKKGSNESKPEVIQNKSKPAVSQNHSSMKGKAIRLIDPTTMLIYQEKIERTIQMEMEIKGLGRVPTKVIETRVFEFDYQQ